MMSYSTLLPLDEIQADEVHKELEDDKIKYRKEKMKE